MPTVLLCVQAVDRINPNSKLGSNKLYKRGDVICIVPADHEFSKAELTSPNFTIIKADLTEEEQFALLAPEPIRKAEMTNDQCRRRINYFDMDAVPVEKGAEITKEEFIAAFAVKPEPDLTKLADAVVIPDVKVGK